MSKHRGGPDVTRLLYPDDFTPRHCAGASCFHTHQGEQPLPIFARLDDPVVPPKCGRPGAHGSHDVTSLVPSEPSNWRCPGSTAAHGLPGQRVKERAEQARAAIGGAR